MNYQKLISFILVLTLLTGCGTIRSNEKGELKNRKNIQVEKDKKEELPTVLIDGKKIDLNNSMMSISIDAKTLEVINTDKNGNEVCLSDPLGNFNIDEIKTTKEGVKYHIIDEDVEVKVSLKGDRLNIHFSTEKEMSFTWPKVGSTKGFDSYIIPYNEGKYIPKKDQTFIKFLTQYDSWDTIEFLSMPFIGLRNDLNTYTYIMENGYNDEIEFKDVNENLGFSINHQFTSNHDVKEFSYQIIIGENDYIMPAKVFRDYLIETNQFVSLEEKAKKAKNLDKLYGAAQIYLWSSGVLDRRDIGNWLGFVKKINNNKNNESISKRIVDLLPEESEVKKLIQSYINDGYVDQYGRKTIIRDINQVLKRKDFYKESAFRGQKKSEEVKALLNKGINNLNDTEIYELNLRLFYEGFEKFFEVKIEDVGNAFSTKMLDELQKLGIKKAWLGGDNMGQNWQLNKYAAKKALEQGYLIGSYDSYHSMHEPGQVQWDTAGFDKKLWETGGIMRKNGSYVGGYKQVGRKVSPLLAMPYVKERMGKIMDSIKLDSWFVDCDAAGELYEDYNPLHPASEEDDANARKERLQWMIDKYGLVVGSEGGHWYLSDTIHFAQGMMTPVIAWNDKDMRQNRDSKYYLGKYWPSEGPQTFVKQVPLKEEYGYIYFNPKFRLPLYQTVYHDSIVTTSHWGSSSLKFTNQIVTNALTELLYNVQPLYNLNLEELEKHGEFISKQYNVFSKMHEITVTKALSQYEILSKDRLVQKTKFGDKVEVIANYKTESFEYEGRKIPAKSVEIYMIEDGVREIYTP
ncbi:glycoside hydrolase [Tepidibacter hydrothermalis]|uniref:Glycoside hydrolase n=1 Tax=Tepidibacter hydrothermalis TaxID=3036126 RepID=A0ABY8EFZ6_9FIRM|nr:glycoside hydrolase [Tepidibacter hydrothermalis]WFD11870.1 glycoside hydrolase [Tepidibacter hydrothermalis]